MIDLILKINDTTISNNDILDKIEFSYDMGENDYTVGKFILPICKLKLSDTVSIQYGDKVTITLVDNGTDYSFGVFEPYEITQGNLSRDVTLYSMPYFALIKTYSPTLTNYTTRSLVQEMMLNILFEVEDLTVLDIIDLGEVESATALELLQRVAMLSSCNVTINKLGQIAFKQITSSTTIHAISSSNIVEINKSDTNDYLITQITGKLNDNDETPIIVGTSANEWNNLTIINPHLTQALCLSILANISAINYSGFDLRLFNAPIDMNILDKASFTFKGTDYIVPIMNLETTYSRGGLVSKISAKVSNTLDKTTSYKGTFSSRLDVINNLQQELNTRVEVNEGEISTLISNTTVITEEGQEITLKDAFSQLKQDVNGFDITVGDLENRIEANKEAISTLQINADSISASVKQVEESMADTVDGINQNIETLTNRVDATMTATDVQLEIQSALANGITEVTTTTGFTFNETGLTVNKSDSEMSTTITEDGMIVKKNDEDMLTCNNQGVNAVNLHATTYLIIGTNSRFENFECGGRPCTACFWIGSVSTTSLNEEEGEE